MYLCILGSTLSSYDLHVVNQVRAQCSLWRVHAATTALQGWCWGWSSPALQEQCRTSQEPSAWAPACRALPVRPLCSTVRQRVAACFSKDVKDLNPFTGVIVLHSSGDGPACLASAGLGVSILCPLLLGVDMSLPGPCRPLTVELLCMCMCTCKRWLLKNTLCRAVTEETRVQC